MDQISLILTFIISGRIYHIHIDFIDNITCLIINHRALVNLLPTAYEKEERGKIEVKGKGEMTTFWIKGKSGRTPPTKEEVCK